MEKNQFTLPDKDKLKALREVWKNLQAKGFYEPSQDNPMGYSIEDPEEQATKSTSVASPTAKEEKSEDTFEDAYRKKLNPEKRFK